MPQLGDRRSPGRKDVLVHAAASIKKGWFSVLNSLLSPWDAPRQIQRRRKRSARSTMPVKVCSWIMPFRVKKQKVASDAAFHVEPFAPPAERRTTSWNFNPDRYRGGEDTIRRILSEADRFQCFIQIGEEISVSTETYGRRKRLRARAPELPACYFAFG